MNELERTKGGLMYYLTWNGEIIEEEIVELSDAKFLRDEYM